jgi:hypothetical protein
MEKLQRTKTERCPSCGQMNRVGYQPGLPRCGRCGAALPPIPPVKPATPAWGSPLGLLRHLCNERRLPNLCGYWQEWWQFLADRRSYDASNSEFRLLEEARQLRVEEERQRQALLEAERQRRAEEERLQRELLEEERQRLEREERQRRALEQQFRAEAARRLREEDRLAREEWIALHRRLQFDQLDQLTGPEFEQRLATLFRQQRYVVELTKGSGDQGADLLLRNGSIRIAVQAKRYKARVGNDAVQELLGGMTYYDCSRGIVVTTSGFTRSAKELAARATGVELWGREELRAHFVSAFPSDTPPFSWESYRRLKSSLEQGR